MPDRLGDELLRLPIRFSEVISERIVSNEDAGKKIALRLTPTELTN